MVRQLFVLVHRLFFADLFLELIAPPFALPSPIRESLVQVILDDISSFLGGGKNGGRLTKKGASYRRLNVFLYSPADLSSHQFDFRVKNCFSGSQDIGKDDTKLEDHFETRGVCGINCNATGRFYCLFTLIDL